MQMIWSYCHPQKRGYSNT
uniref:Uncharacterized protein n=1 Tax=Anguilla anguilla TaxID=7936 RepID=A0A0E9UNL4_ANGAN